MCDHKTYREMQARKDVAGLIFSYATKQCADCGSVLWSQKNEAQFQQWLGAQRKRHGDKFVVQKVQIPSDLADFAIELAESNHSTTSAVFQACLSFYFIRGASQPELLEVLANVQPGAQPLILQSKFRVKPKLFVKLDASAKLFNQNMNEVASWVIQRVLYAARAGLQSMRNEIEFALAA